MCVLHERGLYGKVARTDIQSILDLLSYMRLIKRVKILGATYYCTPDVPHGFVPPELREILEAIRSMVMKARSSAIGITTRAIASKLREKLPHEPSSQVIMNTLKALLHEAGLDVVDGKPSDVSKKDRRRGTVYIFHRDTLLEVINRYLNGHVQHEEKTVKVVRSDVKQIIKELKNLIHPRKHE